MKIEPRIKRHSNVTVRIQEENRDWLFDKAQEHEVSVAELVDQIITTLKEEELEEEDKPRKKK